MGLYSLSARPFFVLGIDRVHGVGPIYVEKHTESPPRRIADFVRGMRVRKLNFHVTTGPIRAIIKSKFATNRRTGPDGGGG